MNCFIYIKKVKYEITARRPGDIAECYADPTKAKEELFGTLFVCSSYESYLEMLSYVGEDSNFQHYMYEVISNSGINSIILSPTNFNNFGAYKKIVFLDPVLSKGYVNAIAKVTNLRDISKIDSLLPYGS